jgi:hypothetical protein
LRLRLHDINRARSQAEATPSHTAFLNIFTPQICATMATDEMMDVDMDIVIDTEIDHNNDLEDDEIARMHAEINEINSLVRAKQAHGSQLWA